MNRIVSFLFIAIFLVSCSEYQKALKSDDVAIKNEAANKKYEAGKYLKAIRLYEQIAPAYKGKPNAERMFYFYSMSLYKSEQYYLAGYQLENFVATYPKSEKREECAFYAAECFYRLSPVYSLDQTDTEKALDKMQRFIDIYPESQFLPQANVYVKELREKLEKKAFEIAKQYNTISDFKGALKAFENFLADYPGTPYKEQALYYRFDSAYKLAINSVESKKQERLVYAKNTYTNLIKHNGQTEYKEEADKMLAELEQELQKYTK
ncbi:MAG: outer membrane protein assembly factor BamD [Flavobacterium sp.]|jgi:outer membrane protein assembly factor BamD|uniref:outer membrane protein assembly factor BamD n=1 Tax=Flavobacterium sp. TaxID=239 RepID=UPI0011D3C240|nr:outer membrane protein assembly factor BamD [Flavobacterium sp.]MCK6608830.1 outer membrane protein assembly factor BamD [Flavobacterium sp.]TXI69028.1 MAG: outer membrane protein assembly factor BamD [Flavobacterium sp.]